MMQDAFHLHFANLHAWFKAPGGLLFLRLAVLWEKV